MKKAVLAVAAVTLTLFAVVQETAIKDPGMFPRSGSWCSISKGNAKSAKCKAGYEEGHKNLGSIPKPSGKGFTASYFKLG